MVSRQAEADLWEEMIGMGVVNISLEFMSLYLLTDVPRIIGALALPGTVEGRVDMLDNIITKMQ